MTENENLRNDLEKRDLRLTTVVYLLGGGTPPKLPLVGMSAKLQRRYIDVFEVYTMIDNIKSEVTSYIGTKDNMPRVPRVQCNRSNVPADTPLLYYKRSIGIPFIDILLQQLQNRFSADNCWPNECFAESNTIFNCQTRDASPRSI